MEETTIITGSTNNVKTLTQTKIHYPITTPLTIIIKDQELTIDITLYPSIKQDQHLARYTLTLKAT